MADRMATRYHTRPSSFFAVDDPYLAYCLDEAVMVFATGVESRIEAVPEQKGKKAGEKRQRMQQDVLDKLLGIKSKKPKQKYRDPADLLK